MQRKPTSLAWFARQLSAARTASRNAPLFALATTVAVAVDVFAWGGLFSTDAGDITIAGFSFSMAWPEAIVSTAMSLAALILAGAAASQRSDPRKDQRKRANATQLLAFVVLAAPVFYAGQALALQDMRAERIAYIGSDQHLADQHASRDPSLDSAAQQAAADRLAKATPVTSADLDHLIPCVLWIAFVLGCNMAAVRLGWRAPPETEAEQSARLALAKAALASARARQAVQTRKARERGELPRVVARS